MIGIYQDSFKQYLEDNLGEYKLTVRNIITKCPWCEFGQEKDHYHLYISLEAPICHCFHAGCEKGGKLSKFLSKVAGHDISDAFVDKQVEKVTNKKIKRWVNAK